MSRIAALLAVLLLAAALVLASYAILKVFDEPLRARWRKKSRLPTFVRGQTAP